MNSFKVNRDLLEGRYRLRDVFFGLDGVEPLQRCFADNGRLTKILDETYVTVRNEPEYMYIDDEDGSLIVESDYLKTADIAYLYLDIIHELVHVKQYLDGKKLFDKSYSYVDRPTEIEAYRCSVEEARKIGLTESAIADYLYVEWITKVEHRRLLRTLGVQPKCVLGSHPDICLKLSAIKFDLSVFRPA